MKIIKSSRFAFIAAISMFLANLAMGYGVLTTANWVSESYSSYDVILSGTGPGWAGTVISPSGLWQLDSDNRIEYPYSTTDVVSIDNYGDAAYLGLLPPQYPTPTPYQPYINIGLPNYTGAAIYSGHGYEDMFQPTAPINDGNGFGGAGGGYLSQGGPNSYLNWAGSSTISITSIPDVNDTSTWTWQAEYYAYGNSLEPVPEPAAISIAALAAVLGVASIKRRHGKLV